MRGSNDIVHHALNTNDMTQTTQTRYTIKHIIVLSVIALFGAFVILPSLPFRSHNPPKYREAERLTLAMAQHAKSAWETSCAFPKPFELAYSDQVSSCGGFKHLLVAQHGTQPPASIDISKPYYFTYTTKIETEGKVRRYTISARADFNCDTPTQHTQLMTVVGTKQANNVCAAKILPGDVLHEFE